MQQPEKHILICRLSAIGDCVETLPLAMAIKSIFPSSKLTWVVDCAADQLLKEHVAIDEVIRCRKGFLTRYRDLLELRKRLRSKPFDIAFDPQGLLKSAIVGFLSGAPVRIGFDSSQARERAWWLLTDRVRATKDHLVDRHLQLLEPLGVEQQKVEFGMKVTDESREWCDAVLSRHGLQRDGFAVINPGAGWESRRWPPDRFGKVAQALWEQHGLKSIIVWSGDEERGMADAIARESANSIIAPPTNLLQLSAFLDSARFLLSADTGPMHMAVALGVPCVALFAVTRPEHCGPYGTIHEVVVAPRRTNDQVNRKQDGNELMQRISVAEVLASCESLLKRLNRSPRHRSISSHAA